MKHSRPALAAGAAALALCAAGAAAASAPAPSHATRGPRIETVRVSADPTGKLAFVQKRLSAKAGRVRFVFTNRSSVAHDLALEVAGTEHELGATRVIQRGRALLTLRLRKGTYAYYCNVPGHEDAGMTGVLSVR